MKKERERTLGIVHAHKKLDVVQQEVCVLRKSLQAQLIDAPARLLVLVDELLQLRCSFVWPSERERGDGGKTNQDRHHGREKREDKQHATHQQQDK